MKYTQKRISHMVLGNVVGSVFYRHTVVLCETNISKKDDRLTI